MDYYVVKDKTVKAVKDHAAFRVYMDAHDGSAPDIPEGAIKLDSALFENLSGIKSLYIPQSFESLDANVFNTNKDITINYANYYDLIIRSISPDKKYILNFKLKCIHNRDRFNDYCKSNEGAIPMVPEGVTSVSDFVFKGNSNIKKIKLPESAICICKQACANLKNLEEVQLAKAFLDFGEEVFANCKNLKGTFIVGEKVCVLRANVFAGCNKEIKIRIFDRYLCDLDEFLLKNRMKDLPNIVESDFNTAMKSLRTNNNFYVYNNGTVQKISKDSLEQLCGYDKNIGCTKKNLDRVFYENKGCNALRFYECAKENNINFPIDFVICDTDHKLIDAYCRYNSIFNKRVLSHMREISPSKTENPFGKFVGRLTERQYELLHILACISGFYSGEDLRQKSVALFTKTLFGVETGKYKTLKFNLHEFEDIFGCLLGRAGTFDYNPEFSQYFLYNFDNLEKLIQSVKDHKKNGDPLFLANLLKNSGESQVLYSHDDVVERSRGLLHDKWIGYKINNNNKQKNEGTDKKTRYTLNFIDWACDYGDGSSALTELDLSREEEDLVKPFIRFYNDRNSLSKIVEIFKESKCVFQYALLPDTSKLFAIKKNSFNIAKVGSETSIYRDFYIAYPVSPAKESVEKLYCDIEEKLHTNIEEEFIAKAIKKSDLTLAFANCEMGHCANVKANGCEYLFESYIDKDCQPFMIFKKLETEELMPVANFRIDLNRNNGIGEITCLEVKPEVKFSYSQEQKIHIVKVFQSIINKYVSLYNEYNDTKLSIITMGQITHCDINDVLSLYFPVLSEPVAKNEKRKVVAPSEYNHYVVWQENKNNSSLFNL